MKNKNIFIACDISNQKDVINLLEKIHHNICGIKIGLQYITQRSPDDIRELLKFEKPIFYDGKFTRSWNISNNIKYTKAITTNKLPFNEEKLNINDLYNEFIMTGLRKEDGVSLEKVRSLFGDKYKDYLIKQSENHIINKNMFFDGDKIKISKKAKFLTDGLSSDLFFIRN